MARLPCPSRTPRLLAATVALALAGCLPELPDERRIDDLRVLAIQQSPAVLPLGPGAAGQVTLRALTVDPDDAAGEGTDHTWTLDLDDDVDGVEQLRQLVPTEPHGPDLALDLAPLVGSDVSALPFRYVVDNGAREREALRLLLADPGSVDPLPGDDGNPRLARLEVDDRSWGPEDLPTDGRPLEIGEVEDGEGIVIKIAVAGGANPATTQATLFWTRGCPGLPELFDVSDADSEACPDSLIDSVAGDSADAYATFYGVEDPDDAPRRQFGWFPWRDAPDRETRLFLVLLDEAGGQSWLELLPREPERVPPGL